jgi:hypothetical protein
MVQKPKAVKLKVILGYILLLSFAVISVWFVYTEILKAALPANTDDDNKKIIRISNTIADLYASEALARTSILTGDDNDLRRYNKTLDSIKLELESIKKEADAAHTPKFDSIQLLLELKRKSTADIVTYRQNSGNSKAFNRAIRGIYNTKDSITSRIKPVKITKRYSWTDIVNSALTPRQLDSLSKLDVSNDSLAMAFEKVINGIIIKESRLQFELYTKEQKLLEENLVISDQLRALLSSVESEILHNSYLKINRSQAGINKTINTMAWMGAAALIILIIFAWIILSDLTSNQNYRKQLELLNRENEQLLRSKTMLMATVTHDLQTPLGSIIGFSDLIDSSDITGKQKQYVHNIKESADYILKLVNDLLDFSKLENNKIAIEEVSFNVKSLIENTCKALEPAAANKNIELSCDVDDELDSNFISDPYRIKQVLTNLISNSIKFTPEGSVEVTAGIKGDNIIISVLDTGIGIEKEKQEEVFKEFTQAHSGIEKRFGGTGLGLNISKRILKLLGGTITLESQLGQGSIFTLTIPRVPCKASGTYNAPEEQEMPCNDVSSLEGLNILVIDDDITQLSLMKELLSGYGSNVTTEANSTAAVSVIGKGGFDLVLTDIQMPGLDGFDVVRSIRNNANPVIAGVPVIALSGRKDLNPEDYTTAGFTAHHPKPIDLQVLIPLIAKIFGEEIEIKVPEKKGRIEAKLFNLKSLSQFTHNDPASLKMIVETFTVSAEENCIALQQAINEKDKNRISAIAHKMIPMLRQMEVYSIVKLLDPLEDNSIQDWEEIEERVSAVCDQTQNLIHKLKMAVS